MSASGEPARQLSSTNRPALKQVARAIEEAVEGADLPASFRALLFIPLRQRGKLLGGSEQPRWPLLVLAACEAAGGEAAAAIPVAAAVEIFIAALDVLDELEDGDHSPLVDAAGPAVALNCTTTLLMLAQGLISQALPAHAARIIRLLASAGVIATGGQYLDLTAEGRADIAPADALDIASRKAGALCAGACQAGAALGAGDDTLLALYGSWGRHHGTAAQLVNDYHDAYDDEPPSPADTSAPATQEKTDREREKGSLPLLFGRRTNARGALHRTWLIFEIERQAALEALDTLDCHGQSTGPLRALMR